MLWAEYEPAIQCMKFMHALNSAVICGDFIHERCCTYILNYNTVITVGTTGGFIKHISWWQNHRNVTEITHVAWLHCHCSAVPCPWLQEAAEVVTNTWIKYLFIQLTCLNNIMHISKNNEKQSGNCVEKTNFISTLKIFTHSIFIKHNFVISIQFSNMNIFVGEKVKFLGSFNSTLWTTWDILYFTA